MCNSGAVVRFHFQVLYANNHTEMPQRKYIAVYVCSTLHTVKLQSHTTMMRYKQPPCSCNAYIHIVRRIGRFWYARCFTKTDGL